MSLKYIEFIWFGNLLLMRRSVWNTYSIIILADNCGCGVISHCGLSRGHCCILGTTLSCVFWQLTTPLIKQTLGLSKYSYHSKILTALNVSQCIETINNCRINLWRMIFKVYSPLCNLCCFFAARYIGHGDVFPQTLAPNVMNMGLHLFWIITYYTLVFFILMLL